MLGPRSAGQEVGCPPAAGGAGRAARGMGSLFNQRKFTDKEPAKIQYFILNGYKMRHANSQWDPGIAEIERNGRPNQPMPFVFAAKSIQGRCSTPSPAWQRNGKAFTFIRKKC